MGVQRAIGRTVVQLTGGISELGIGTPLGVFFFVIGAIALYAAIDRYRKSALVKNTPTERVQSIALGRTEVIGRCKPAEDSFNAPFTEDDCVYASWSIEEYNSQKGGWEPVADDNSGVAFYIEDDTGQVLVENPEDATVSVTERSRVRAARTTRLSSSVRKPVSRRRQRNGDGTARKSSQQVRRPTSSVKQSTSIIRTRTRARTTSESLGIQTPESSFSPTTSTTTSQTNTGKTVWGTCSGGCYWVRVDSR